MARGATMTLKEAAALIGVTPATLRQQIARKRLHAVKEGRDWKLEPADVEAYRTGRRRKEKS